MSLDSSSFGGGNCGTPPSVVAKAPGPSICVMINRSAKIDLVLKQPMNVGRWWNRRVCHSVPVSFDLQTCMSIKTLTELLRDLTPDP